MTVVKNFQLNFARARQTAMTLIFAVLALAFVLVLPSGLALANTTGDDDLLRVSDFTKTLSDDEKSGLSRMVKDEINTLEFDFVAVLDDTESSTSERAKSFYEHNDFGYSEDDDGIILFISTKTQKASIYTCGLGTKIFSDEDTKAVRKAVKSTMANSYYDAIYLFFNSAVCKVADYRGATVGENWSVGTAVSASAATDDENSGNIETQAVAGKTTADLSWYPKDPEKFKDFHNDKSVSRVVDNADLLTNAEEAELAIKIEDMQERTGLDFVLYTDTSSYGLDRGVFAADFYQFNGYGFDDEYSGVVYFVCMESGNRGFWTAACGSARELLTEENVNAMDDETYNYFKNGNYGTAIATQFDNLNYLYTNGSLPFDWTPFIGGGFFGVIVGVICGFVRLRGKRRQMKTIEKASEASRYVVGAPHFTLRQDTNLGTKVNRVPRPKDNDSGGGGSSYSGSYSSSGGRSFSGGGRSF